MRVKTSAIYIFCFISIAFHAECQVFNTIIGREKLVSPNFGAIESHYGVKKESEPEDTTAAAAASILQIDYRRNTSLPLRRIRVTSTYGYRNHPVLGGISFHSGVDLATSQDTVFAIFDGTVAQTSYDNNLGLNIQLLHEGEVRSIYGHLSRIFMTTGQSILSGQAIGISGSTGRSTGEHLHFTVRRNDRIINPMLILKYLIESELNYEAMDLLNSLEITK